VDRRAETARRRRDVRLPLTVREEVVRAGAVRLIVGVGAAPRVGVGATVLVLKGVTVRVLEGTTVRVPEGVIVRVPEGVIVRVLEGVSVRVLEGVSVRVLEGATVPVGEGVIVRVLEGVTVRVVEIGDRTLVALRDVVRLREGEVTRARCAAACLIAAILSASLARRSLDLTGLGVEMLRDVLGAVTRDGEGTGVQSLEAADVLGDGERLRLDDAPLRDGLARRIADGVYVMVPEEVDLRIVVGLLGLGAVGSWADGRTSRLAGVVGRRALLITVRPEERRTVSGAVSLAAGLDGRVGVRSSSGRTRRLAVVALGVGAERLAAIEADGIGAEVPLRAADGRRTAATRAFLASIIRWSPLLEARGEEDARSVRRGAPPARGEAVVVGFAAGLAGSPERLSAQACEGRIAVRTGAGRRHACPSPETYGSGERARWPPPRSRWPSWCLRRPWPTRPGRQP